MGTDICCAGHQVQGVRRAPFDVLKTTPLCVGLLHCQPVLLLNFASTMCRMPPCAWTSATEVENIVTLSISSVCIHVAHVQYHKLKTGKTKRNFFGEKSHVSLHRLGPMC